MLARLDGKELVRPQGNGFLVLKQHPSYLNTLPRFFEPFHVVLSCSGGLRPELCQARCRLQPGGAAVRARGDRDGEHP